MSRISRQLHTPSCEQARIAGPNKPDEPTRGSGQPPPGQDHACLGLRQLLGPALSDLGATERSQVRQPTG